MLRGERTPSTAGIRRPATLHRKKSLRLSGPTRFVHSIVARSALLGVGPLLRQR